MFKQLKDWLRKSKMKKLPFNYLLVADTVNITETGQIQVFNIYNSLKNNVFPFSRDVVFMLGIIPLEFESEVSVFINEQSTGQDIVRHTQLYKPVQIGKIVSLIGKIDAVKFPRPGIYMISVSVNGVMMEKENFYQLNVEEIPPTDKLVSNESFAELLDKHLKVANEQGN